MNDSLEAIMERASVALAGMDYLSCQALCLEALTLARQQENWADYARVLLPLQEARRQVRIIAAESAVRLGSTDLSPSPWGEGLGRGACCLLLTRPHTPADAAALREEATRRRLHVQVLYADNPAGAERWTLRSFAGPEVRCEIAAPRRHWIDRWLIPPADAADYFLDAAEALGDAALAQVTDADPRKRLAQLEARLAVVPDHEILHQRLGDAARALRVNQP